MIELNYMTTKTAAAAWGISQRRVLALCADDRIDGLARVENIWLIPKEAGKPADGRSLRHTKDGCAAVKPFVKWAGGKGQLLENLRSAYPEELGRSITKYAEPFVGGGAVLFDVLSRYQLEAVYISDVNAELINAYQMIKTHVGGLIDILATMQDEYHGRDDIERREYYYAKRSRFNELKLNGDSEANVESAALFIYLNKTCFNGLYRVNRKGFFNVPIGSHKNPLICDEENLLNISKALKNVIIYWGDYGKSEAFIDKETFVYIDPPYRPLNATSGFTSYTEVGFNDAAQIELAEFVNAISEKGARIVMSNSDPKNADEADSFFDDLYSTYYISRVDASRAINSKSEKRGKIKELLITNF